MYSAISEHPPLHGMSRIWVGWDDATPEPGTCTAYIFSVSTLPRRATKHQPSWCQTKLLCSPAALQQLWKTPADTGATLEIPPPSHLFLTDCRKMTPIPRKSILISIQHKQALSSGSTTVTCHSSLFTKSQCISFPWTCLICSSVC